MAAAAALVAMGGSAGRSEQGGEGRGGRRLASDANGREESRARVRRGCRSRHGVVVAASATILGVRARKRRRVVRPSSVEKDPGVARSAVGHRRTGGRRPPLDGQKQRRARERKERDREIEV